MSKWITSLAAGVGLLIAASQGSASPLAPGQVAPTQGFPAGLVGPPTVAPGGTLEHTVVAPFTGTTNTGATVFTGTLFQYVIRNSTGYLFEYQVCNDASSLNAIQHVSTTDFSVARAGAVVNADYALRSQMAGINPTPAVGPGTPEGLAFPIFVSRQDINTGSVIEYDFFQVNGVPGLGIMPGECSQILYVQTTATNIDFNGNTAIQDGGNANVRTWEPAAASPVPEPSTLALFGCGIFGMAGFAWRRKVRA